MTLAQEEVLALLAVGEDVDCEFKEAAASFPASFWPTYSAFANPSGGTIVLGIRESGDTLEVMGVQKPEARRKELWDQLQNREKVSCNLLQDADVTVVELDGKPLLVVRVPQASRQQRPVYINGNPLRGSYKRSYEGDYRCQESEVRAMLREASDDVFDTTVLEEFSLADLDSMSLIAYRNRLRAREGDHPWLGLGDQELIEKLGGWRRDRGRGVEGPTLAGVLMFGREGALAEALPHFRPDYQEQLSDDPEVRWTHRITPDGRWEPNLFNFYSRVISRLTMDLEVPFKLDHDLTRLGQTHVHEAMREALVNCLIHADHASTRPILIIRRRHDFIFRNPGRPRLPLEQIYSGGVSDCRNPSLQKMFFMIGAGERAGSGIGKILRAWSEQHWITPLIRDHVELELTEWRLPTISMIPGPVLDEVERTVGPGFASADPLERTALVLAHQFGGVTNSDLQRFTSKHPTEIGKTLRGLVNNGWLSTYDRGRATRYCLPVMTDVSRAQSESATRELRLGDPDPQHSEPFIQHSEPFIQHNEPFIQHNEPFIQHNEPDPRHSEPFIQHGEPFIQHSEPAPQHKGSGLESVSADIPGETPGASHIPRGVPGTDAAFPTEADEWHTLMALASTVRGGTRVPPGVIDSVMLALCEHKPLTARQIAVLLGREPSTVTIHYLPRLLRAGLLRLLYPGQPRRKDQAYMASPRDRRGKSDDLAHTPPDVAGPVDATPAEG